MEFADLCNDPYFLLGLKSFAFGNSLHFCTHNHYLFIYMYYRINLRRFSNYDSEGQCNELLDNPSNKPQSVYV